MLDTDGLVSETLWRLACRKLSRTLAAVNDCAGGEVTPRERVSVLRTRTGTGDLRYHARLVRQCNLNSKRIPNKERS